MVKAQGLTPGIVFSMSRMSSSITLGFCRRHTRAWSMEISRVRVLASSVHFRKPGE
jgi:hypothetical protein